MPKRSKKSPAHESWLQSNPLLQWRKRNNFTLDKLGRQLSLTRQIIYCWENGKSIPRVENAAKLYEYTNVTVEQLIEWKKSKPGEIDESFL